MPTFTRRSFLAAGSLATLGWPSLTASVQADEPQLVVRQADPLNSEPPLPALVQQWITPNERFFIRSHAPTPKLDAKTHHVRVDGLVQRELKFTAEQLRQQFPWVEKAVTVTCAGNRRYEHSRTKPVGGVPWQEGAIGTAVWGGIPLAALLRHVGLQVGAKHVWFEGVDRIEHNADVIGFGGSVSLEKALSRDGGLPGAIVALEMNGQPLPLDHGYPVRMVIPGYIGARSVKWLGRIHVSDRPSPNHYMQTAYKVVTEDRPQAWAAAAPIETWPLNSILCNIAPGQKVRPGKVLLEGYALAPGYAARQIQAVEVSADGGQSWTRAKLSQRMQPFCWRLWRVELPIAAGTGELIVRARDNFGAVQPASVPWNLKGYLYNAWQRLPIETP